MAVAPRDINVSITTGSIITVILFGLLLALLWYLQNIVLIVLTAVVIASAIEPGVRVFMRRGLPRILSVLALYLIVIGTFFGILFFFLPPILDDAANFLSQLPATLRSFN